MSKIFTNKEIGARIRNLRKERSMSTMQLANKLGVSEETLKKWEGGERSIHISHFQQLANLWEISIDYLIGRTEYTNIGNQEISESTGLTNKTIDKLRSFNEKGYDKPARVLNYLFDEVNHDELYNEVEEEIWYVRDDMLDKSILSDIHDYIFGVDSVHTIRWSEQNDPPKEEKELSISDIWDRGMVVFQHTEGDKTYHNYIVARELFAQYIRDAISLKLRLYKSNVSSKRYQRIEATSKYWKDIE